ncbi:MAG: DUF488 domain-containing protein [Defluviitaleaceae bacterium]|nr:DUF488 domain-containing protein [Defluviitaleaceae bacterium]
MKLYTIGFTQKSAEDFFELIKKNKIDLLLDVRLNNKSQLAGFAKGNDMAYFLREICQCDYKHCIEFAPTKDILDDYKGKKISWGYYENRYTSLIENRKAHQDFFIRFDSFNKICLLCSEPTADKCHRRLLSEILKKNNNAIEIKHI